MNARSVAAPTRKSARMMLLRAFFAQNVAIGCSFGGFGVSVLALQERYHSSRGAASMGLAIVVLTMSLLGPVAALMIGRIGLRATMLLGLFLSGIGYVALAFAPDMTVVLTIFGLLIGPGIGLFGNFSSSMLAGGWYPEHRGRAVGIANVPLFVAIVPLVGMVVLAHHGLSAFFLCLAGLHLLLLPLVLGIRDAPAVSPPGAGVPTHGVSAGGLLGRPLFWLMVAGGGLLTATSIVAVSHIVPIAMEKGVPAGQAAIFLSVMGGASALGSILIGFICDRMGGPRSLALLGLGFAISWAILISITSLPLMFGATLMVGLCGAGIFPAVNVLSAKAFDIAVLPRAVGLYGLFALPFDFLLPAGAGALRDMAGNYAPVMGMIVAICATVAFLFFAVARVEDRRGRFAGLAGAS